MFKERKIDVYRDDQFLEITLSWFSPMAIFFGVFGMVWVAFLVFWYSMVLTGQAPWIFAVVPIIHVLVGFWLIYYSLCLFFNKTYVDITAGDLSVTHKPIPWWRGNKQLATRDIEQLYVKENKRRGKGGARYSYELRAKLYDRSDVLVMNIGNATSQQMQEIEEHLEAFIGITDEPVKGEYQSVKTDVTRPPQSKRQSGPNFTHSPFGKIYKSRKGKRLDFQNKNLEIIDVSQYRWKDGQTDKLLQLMNSAHQETRLYLRQNQALLSAFEEKTLSLFETQDIAFDPKKAPASIEIAGKRYRLEHFQIGKLQTAGIDSGEVEQWWYQTEDKAAFLRVVNLQGILQFHQGTQKEIEDFEKGLDLNRSPMKDLRYDKNNWDDEELV